LTVLYLDLAKTFLILHQAIYGNVHLGRG